MGKITLSFASPEKENYLFYIYEVITWGKRKKSIAIHYFSAMGALDRRLYTSHHAPTDTVSRLGPDRVKLARTGCMSSGAGD